MRPENSLRKKNIDRMFANSFIDDMLEVCKFFGPNAVSFMSNDGRARTPLGLAVANLQAQLLIHMECKGKLLNHDFVIGLQHKVIPSVYETCTITNNGDILYGGDTFIRIRSGKHDTLNAYTHVFDVRDIFASKLVKRRPIFLTETHGVQDEAPHFPKTLATTVDLFRLLDLDDLLHEVNASGLSDFNPVKYNMAPVSHDYVHFSNHLDSSGKIIDVRWSRGIFKRQLRSWPKSGRKL